MYAKPAHTPPAASNQRAAAALQYSLQSSMLTGQPAGIPSVQKGLQAGQLDYHQGGVACGMSEAGSPLREPHHTPRHCTMLACVIIDSIPQLSYNHALA